MVKEVYRKNGLSTCANNHYFSAEKNNNKCPVCGRLLEVPGQTEYKHPSILDNDSACGALVCVNGTNIGKPFAIHCGLNPIGSDESMKICIPNDDKIKTINHTNILFDGTEKNAFLTMHGNSTSLAYLNDSLVVDIEKITTGDIIKIGNSKLRYIEFSTSEFNWENEFGEKY